MQLTILEVAPEDKFRIWYKEPFQMLEEMNKGNGAIIALMMSLPLYERAYRHKVSTKEIRDNRPLWVKEDLKLKTEEEARKFWNAFRDGLCHTGSFFEENDKGEILPQIGLDAKYPDLPEFTKDQNGKDVIIVNPWKLVSHILQKYEGNIPLLEYAPAPLLPLHYIIESRGT
jgi:hypothetical protein